MNKVLNRRLRFAKNQKGMTLIELMAVVVILGVLSSVAGVAVTKGFDSSKVNADNSSVKIVADALQRHYMDTQTEIAGADVDAKLQALKAAGYLSNVPTIQETGKSLSISFDTAKKIYTVALTTATTSP